MWLKILKLIFVFGVAVLAFNHGESISISTQKPLFEGLRNTSAIIFGVMGAWLAILHPDSLKKVFGKEGGSFPENERRTVMLLLSPIIISTIIIAIVLVLFPLIEFSKTIDVLLRHKEFLRSSAFSLLSVLTLLQLWALILTLLPSDIVKKHIDKEKAKKAVARRMFSKTTRKVKTKN